MRIGKWLMQYLNMILQGHATLNRQANTSESTHRDNTSSSPSRDRMDSLRFILKRSRHKTRNQRSSAVSQNPPESAEEQAARIIAGSVLETAGEPTTIDTTGRTTAIRHPSSTVESSPTPDSESEDDFQDAYCCPTAFALGCKNITAANGWYSSRPFYTGGDFLLDFYTQGQKKVRHSPIELRRRKHHLYGRTAAHAAWRRYQPLRPSSLRTCTRVSRWDLSDYRDVEIEGCS